MAVKKLTFTVTILVDSEQTSFSVSDFNGLYAESDSGDCMADVSLDKVQDIKPENVEDEEKLIGGDGSFFKILND